MSKEEIVKHLEQKMQDLLNPAKIPKYESRKARNALNKTTSFYFDRELIKDESAIEIIILSSDEKVLRTERAVDYEMFVKK